MRWELYKYGVCSMLAQWQLAASGDRFARESEQLQLMSEKHCNEVTMLPPCPIMPTAASCCHLAWCLLCATGPARPLWLRWRRQALATCLLVPANCSPRTALDPIKQPVLRDDLAVAASTPNLETSTALCVCSPARRLSGCGTAACSALQPRRWLIWRLPHGRTRQVPPNG